MEKIKEFFFIHGMRLRDNFAQYPIITDKQKNDLCPFFIISAGRSGSTLLRTMLVKGGQVNIPPETNNILPSSYMVFFKLLRADWNNISDNLLKEFFKDSSFQYWNVNKALLKKKIMLIPSRDRSLAKIIDTIYQEFNGSTGLFWGDKTPFLNLRIPFILNIFPKAKFINLIRDGRDVIASRINSFEGENIERAAKRWADSLQLSEVHEKKLPKNQWLNLYYEKLVTKPKENLKLICDFLEISFKNEMIYGKTNSNLGDTILPHHANTKNEINVTSIGKWKQSFNHKDLELIYPLIEVWLTMHGYKI